MYLFAALEPFTLGLCNNLMELCKENVTIIVFVILMLGLNCDLCGFPYKAVGVFGVSGAFKISKALLSQTFSMDNSINTTSITFQV